MRSITQILVKLQNSLDTNFGPERRRAVWGFRIWGFQLLNASSGLGIGKAVRRVVEEVAHVGDYDQVVFTMVRVQIEADILPSSFGNFMAHEGTDVWRNKKENWDLSSGHPSWIFRLFTGLGEVFLAQHVCQEHFLPFIYCSSISLAGYNLFRCRKELC